MNAVKVNENQGATVIKMPDRKNRSYIPNEFFDTIARIRVPGEQMQVLSVIARKTWCWDKTSDLISKSQIVMATGISKTHIGRAVNALVERKIIKVTKNGNYSMQEFEINTDFEEWEEVTKKGNVTKIGNRVTKIGKKKLPNLGPTKETITKETITKENKTYSSDFCKSGGSEFDKNQVFIPENLKNISIEEIESSIPQEPVIPEIIPAEQPKPEKPKRETCLSVVQADMFSRFWALYPKHRRKEKPKAEKAFKAISPDESLFTEIMEGLQAAINSDDWQKDNGQFVCYPERFLKNQKWTDEYDSGRGFKKSGCPMTNYMAPADLEAEAAKYADLLPDPEDWLK